MNSIRERIVLAVMAKLLPVATSHDATLHRSPVIAITRDQCPALVLFPESDAVTDRPNDRIMRELTLRLVALARTVPPDAPEIVADALLAAAHAALFTDVNLDGLALGIKELDAEWETEDADATAAAIPARYAIAYRTLAHDITQKG
jgi:hypothetical protein